MRPMMRAELLRLRTIRTTWLAVAGTAAMAILVAGHVVRHAVEWGRPDGGLSYLFIPAALIPAGVALLMGLVAVSGEFQHRTADSSLLACPDRRRWVAAKVVVQGGIGAALALVGHVVAYGLAAVALPLFDRGGLGLPSAAEIAGGLATAPLLAALGVAIGAWTRHQVSAVLAVAALPVVPGWLFGWFAWPWAWSPFPDDAVLSLAGAGRLGSEQLVHGLVLATYTVLLLAGALRWSVSRDVT